MKTSQMPVPVIVACLALLPVLLASVGCGSIAGGADGGKDATAGQVGAGGGQAGGGGATGGGGSGSAGSSSTGTAGQGGGAGSTGTAGQGGSAGSTGAAGHGGAGSTGSAGHDGGAGSTGAAGHGGAGSTGSAGHDGGADAGATCSDLETQYSTAMTEAQRCKVGAAGQCAQAASSSLSPCFFNCMTYVNDASTLNALKAQWLAAGCANQRVGFCPAIACLKPTPGNCVAASGGGMCSSTILTAN
jgi:hypothetical protein